MRFSLIRTLVSLLAVLVFLLLFVLPAFSGPLLEAGYMPAWLLRSMGWMGIAQTWVMRLFVVGWIFFFGSCFASFLNVVAWRVPRGRGINGSSHCPHCDVRLTMKDNIPVWGWLRNRGRCRECKTPIAVRYLIVEIALGLVTLGLVALGVFWGGVNLPSGIGHDFRFAMLNNLVSYPQYPLIGITSFQLILVFGLFAASVVRSEGLSVPIAIVGVVVVVGVVFAAIWPRAIVVDCFGNTVELVRFARKWWLTLGLGAAAGFVAGFAFDRVAWFNGPYFLVEQIDFKDNSASVSVESLDAKNVNRSVWSVTDGIASLPVVGLFLGWQALVSIVVLLVLMLPCRMLVGCRACVSLQAQVFLATLVQLSCWRFLEWWKWL